MNDDNHLIFLHPNVKKNLRILYVHPKIFQAFFFISAKISILKNLSFLCQNPIIFLGGHHPLQPNFSPESTFILKSLNCLRRCKSSRHGIRWAPGPKVLGGKTCGAQKKSPRNDGSFFLWGKKLSQHHVSKLASFNKKHPEMIWWSGWWVSTPLKNMSRIGNHLPQFSGWIFPKILEKRHHPVIHHPFFT